jgi:antitoxin component of RelBE/YafQ-DinJ toxin-antitoxin module
MASDTTVRARIDSETKAKAASVLEAMDCPSRTLFA